MAQREDAVQYIRKNKEKFLSSLREVLSIPSISTDPAHNSDMRHAADWMMNQLRALGMQKVQTFSTARHPIVYGEYKTGEELKKARTWVNDKLKNNDCDFSLLDAEVDKIVEAAFEAGAKPSNETQDYGWMYNRAFEDLDGHLWEYAWMDLSQMPKS